MFLCPKCRLFKARRFLDVLNHIRIHESEPGLSLQCGVQDCRRTYEKVESLKKHLYRQHRGFVGLRLDLEDCNTSDTQANDVGCDATDALCTYWGIQQEETVEGMDIVFDSEAESAKDFLRAKALFILKIRDERKLPQVNAILKHITVIILILLQK